MSLHADFAALILPIFGGRVYPGAASAPPTVPYATYSRVSAVDVSTLDTNGGDGNPANTRLQLDVWSRAYVEAQSSAAAVRAALLEWSVENIVLLEQDFYEPDTKLHRVMLDISTWHF